MNKTKTQTRAKPFKPGDAVVYQGSLTQFHGRILTVCGPCECKTCHGDSDRLNLQFERAFTGWLEHVRPTSIRRAR